MLKVVNKCLRCFGVFQPACPKRTHTWSMVLLAMECMSNYLWCSWKEHIPQVSLVYIYAKTPFGQAKFCQAGLLRRKSSRCLSTAVYQCRQQRVRTWWCSWHRKLLVPFSCIVETGAVQGLCLVELHVVSGIYLNFPLQRQHRKSNALTNKSWQKKNKKRKKCNANTKQ